jgi:hypothetical protein
MRPDPAGPADLRDLDYGEHFVIWTLRALVVGRGRCRLVEREFESACGALAVEARGAYFVFVRQLSLRSRRRISVGAPGSLCVTRCEQLIAALFADAQAGAEARFNARLSFLLGRPVEAPFFAAASVVAQALALSGHALRGLPSVERPAQSSARAAAVRLVA